MPTPSAISLQVFMDNYAKYSTYCDYAIQWLDSIQAMATSLQSDPNYATALSPDEQTAVAANGQAARSIPIVPVGPKTNPITPPI